MGIRVLGDKSLGVGDIRILFHKQKTRSAILGYNVLMSVPDEFFKTGEENKKTPYASAIAIVVAVAIVVLIVMSTVERFSLKNLLNKNKTPSISAEEKARILRELQAVQGSTTPISAAEKQKILKELQKSQQAAPSISADEKKRILEELQRAQQ